MSAAAFSPRDLVVHADEPRMHDLKLARALGFASLHEIRRLIARNSAELQRYGSLVTVLGADDEGISVTITENTREGDTVSSMVEETPSHEVGNFRHQDGNSLNRRGRPGTNYFLNEAQALLVSVFSRTPAAETVREALIRVFLAWRSGQLGTQVSANDAPLAEVTLADAPLAAKVSMLHFVLRTRGREAAVAYMPALGLPAIPAQVAGQRSSEAQAVLHDLLEHRIGDSMVRDLMVQAMDGEHIARQALDAFGIKLSEVPEGFWVGSGCDGIKEVFARQPDWLTLLRRLPGVVAGERQTIGGLRTRTSWLPAALID